VIEDFGQLPAPGASLQIAFSTEHRARGRALAVALELGDNLFRRGQYREAHAQFQVALALNPGHTDIRLRVDQCRPHLPPAPVVVARPRVAVLDFVAVGDPAFVPPGVGAWAAEQLAPYLCPPYDVADRG